ncbi:MAG: hypothetical protein P8X46_03600 [Nitrospirales bacterium]
MYAPLATTVAHFGSLKAMLRPCPGLGGCKKAGFFQQAFALVVFHDRDKTGLVV